MVERGDNTNYSLFFQDFSEKSPKPKNEHGDTYFLFNHSILQENIFVKICFLLFQLHSLVCLFCILVGFFSIYSFDLIRILLNKLCKYMLFH